MNKFLKRYLVLLFLLCFHINGAIVWAQYPYYGGYWEALDTFCNRKCFGGGNVEDVLIDVKAHSCANYVFGAEQEEFFEGDIFTFKLLKPDRTPLGECSFMLVWDELLQKFECVIIDCGLNLLLAQWVDDPYLLPPFEYEQVGALFSIKVSDMNILGIWEMEIYYNDELVWADEVEVVSRELPSRNDAFNSLDELWSNFSLERRKLYVKSLFRFNEFTSLAGHYTQTQVRNLIEEVKESNPLYKDIPTDLVLAMTIVESDTNFLAIGSAGELGLGQEKVYDVTIDAWQAFLDLKKSNLTNADFDNFKYNKIRLDERSDPEKAILIMLKHIYELTKLSFIQNDPKKIIAGYNWGQGRLKDYLDILEKKKIDESQWVDKLADKEIMKKPNPITKKYIKKVMTMLEDCQ